MQRQLKLMLVFAVAVCSTAFAEPPDTAYIFPAGAQRGTNVTVRVGGYYLHERAQFSLLGDGVTASPEIVRTATLWFEGPVIPQPLSQRGEDYPKDYLGEINVAADASIGKREWRVRSAQGLTGLRTFVVGDLPEIVEQEVDGAPLPSRVEIPVTINGRIYPREDVDDWTFIAVAGKTYTYEVNASRLGSPLDPHLELFGPNGLRINEEDDTLGADPRLQFTAEQTGEYRLRIRDAELLGLQDRVYRLTITDGPWVNSIYPLGAQRGTETEFELVGANVPASATVNATTAKSETLDHIFEFDGQRSNPVTLVLDDLPEVREESRSDQPVALPAVLNGRILSAGEVDEWRFAAAEGDRIRFDLQAARLGSSLDVVLTVLNEAGEMIATGDDSPGMLGDADVTAEFKTAGVYRVQVRDRLASRGGKQFAYRLRATQETVSPGPDLAINFPQSTINLERGQSQKIKIDVTRIGGLNDEIELLFDNLPPGVEVKNATIPKGRPNTQLELTTSAEAEFGVTPLNIRAKVNHETKVTVDGKPTVQVTEIIRDVKLGSASLDGEDRPILCVSVATPFKFVGIFETKFAPRGSVHLRHYSIERNGFEGPIEISLSDKQIRHLQGVTGPMLVIPPGVNEFDYPVNLSPFLEIGRTSRTQLMAVGVIDNPDGTQSKVAYTSNAQNDQIIVLTDPNRLDVSPDSASLRVTPGAEVELPVSVGRGPGLSGPVEVELILPKHLQGITAQRITIAENSERGSLKLSCGTGEMGPFNQPVKVRATMLDERGLPVVNEAEVALVE